MEDKRLHFCYNIYNSNAVSYHWHCGSREIQPQAYNATDNETDNANEDRWLTNEHPCVRQLQNSQ